MTHLSENLKLIRKVWRSTQDEFAEILSVNRGAAQSYEWGRAEPAIATLLRLQELTGIQIMDLCTREVSHKEIPIKPKQYASIARPPTEVKEPEAEIVSDLINTTVLSREINDIKQRLDKLENAINTKPAS